MNNKLIDSTKIVSKGERNKNIGKVAYKCRHIKRWYEKNSKKTKKSILLLNLLESVADYLEVGIVGFGKHISILAMATRNQHELQLRILSLIQDEKEMDKWQSESATDGLQVLGGFISMSKQPNIYKADVQDEMDHLELLRKKWGMPVVKNSMGAGNLAGKLKMKEEHDNVFKLYSKLVHPSSMLVNKTIGIDRFHILLELSLQRYALESLYIVCEDLQIPSSVSKQYGPKINL